MTTMESPTVRMSREIRLSAVQMTREEIKHVVTTYYEIQDFRKAASNMVNIQRKENRPHELVEWVKDSQSENEKAIRGALKVYAENNPTGQWLLSIHGIGPVIAAGLLAHIDIEKAPTVGNVWSFAGLNPGAVWQKGQKRPWNAELKRLCWIVGDSFVKFSGSDKCTYGRIYLDRKVLEMERNENGDFADQAAAALSSRKIEDAATKAIYEAGKLPAGRLDLRARRVAVKLFLSHFHDVLMWNELGKRAPRPYAIEHMGHAHLIECPNPPWDQP